MALNLFNRLVTTTVLLALAAAALGLLGIVAGLLVADPALLGERLAGEINTFVMHDTPRRILVGSAAGALLLLVLVLLRYELLPLPRHKRPLRVEEGHDGLTTIDHDSVRTLVERTVGHLEDVQAVKASVAVAPDRRTLSLHCRIVARNTAVAHELGPQVRSVVTERLHQQIGLQVARVTTRIRYLPPDEHVLL